METIKTKAVNGDIQAGDLVISTPDDVYTGLIGRVLCINLLGSDAHNEETENETDDVHVNFLEFEYSKTRKKEIEAMFTELYGVKKVFCECPIDDAIMAPSELIRITDIDSKMLDKLLESELNAVSYCYSILSSLVCREVTIVPDNSTTASPEMSDFIISRLVNGVAVEIRLTSQELSDAVICQKHNKIIDSI